MNINECFQILELPYDADLKQIKKAYRLKAFKIHPDANSNADANIKFQELNEAYHILIKYISKNQTITDDEILIKNYRKYGTSIRNKTYNINNNEDKPFVSNQKNSKLNRSSYDKYIFWFVLMIGINMLIFAITDIIKTKKGEEINLNGLFASIPFLILLIIGWNIIKKSE